MNVDNVIDFLQDAEKKTFSSEDKYYLSKARDVLYNMKACRCFNEE